LRKPEFRRKMWDIYAENPNSYKIARFESKRVQQIDRKLKQYYTSSQEHYKTFDASQLEPSRSKAGGTKSGESRPTLKEIGKQESAFAAGSHYATASSSNQAHHAGAAIGGGQQKPWWQLNSQWEPVNVDHRNEHGGSAELQGRFKVEKINEDKDACLA
jgi:hypothetical protein